MVILLQHIVMTVARRTPHRRPTVAQLSMSRVERNGHFDTNLRELLAESFALRRPGTRRAGHTRRVDELAHDVVGQEPSAQCEHQRPVVDGDEPVVDQGSTPPPVRDHVERQPLRQPDAEHDRLDGSLGRVGHLVAGLGCGAGGQRSPHGPSWSWFHHRRPSTWECAEGPMPHQCWFRQYRRLCAERASARRAQFDSSYQSNPASRSNESAVM